MQRYYFFPQLHLLKSHNQFEKAKNRFQLSAGLNLETLNTILSETNQLRLESKPPLKFFKFGLGTFEGYETHKIVILLNAKHF